MSWGAGLSLKGVRGSQFSITNGLPTDTNATNLPNDFALDSTTQLLYVRGTSGWPTSGGVLLRGAMGINGINGSFYAGTGAPTASTYTGPSGGQAVYFQSTGEVWIYSNGSWTDTNESLVGPPGAPGSPGSPGAAGIRGTQTYTGNGAPSNNLSSFNPPAVAGDLYYQLDGGPTLFVLS